MSITIGLIDDQLLFREGLRRMLSSFKDVQVIIESDDSDMFAQVGNGVATPEIVIISSPAIMLNNNAALKDIKRYINSKTKVLTLLANYEEFAVMKMLADGADGCLFKNATPQQFKRAVFGLKLNGSYWPKNVRNLRITDRRPWALNGNYSKFIFLCSSDLHYSEIADIMGLSQRTVEGYRDVLFAKFKVSTRPSLVAFAFRNGLIK